MNHHPPPPQSSGGGPPSPAPARRDLQLQGPRPTPLKVAKTSHQIRKPPPHPRLPPPPSSAAGDSLRRDPVIIYSVSPKVIHATANEFMAIVQRLTGPAPPSPSPTAAGALSPAARMAAVERTSPSERESRGGELAGLDWAVEVGQFPGVLSPAPASLPAIPAGLFSPASEAQTHLFAHDLGSPLWHNIFVASPHQLLSQSPSSFDVYNLFDF